MSSEELHSMDFLPGQLNDVGAILGRHGVPARDIVSVTATESGSYRAFYLTRTGQRPRVVCLCGSTRFYEQFQRANYEETMAGRIVLSVGFYPHASEQAHGESIGITAEQKAALDELHKRKIDLADEILVVNVGGYVGASTRSEIEYARVKGKPIRWLEPPETFYGLQNNKSFDFWNAPGEEPK